MAYQMGQMRFSGSGCVSDSSSVTLSLGDYTSADSTTASGFQDLLVGTTLEKGTPYYLSIPIPQDINYDMTFSVKLYKSDKSYQYLKSFTVPKGGSSSTAKYVALYETLTGNVLAAIPEPYDSTIVEGKEDILYMDEKNKKYYLYTSGQYIPRTQVNCTTLAQTWLTSTNKNFITLDCLFTPVDDSFIGILLEMNRIPEDYSITSTSGNIGRTIDLAAIRSKVGSGNINGIVKKVEDLIPGDIASFSRIGVWGRPGLTLAVNGEEIHIGPSGYYEQDVVPVTSFGVVASTMDDNWTMDYMYNVTETSEMTTNDGGTE